MAENSKIEWCDHTFNPWVGCTKVGPGCDHCYAESWAKRTGSDVWGPGKARRRTKTWDKPLKWNRTLHPSGRKWRVFCASLADVFDNEVPTEWRDDLWGLIRECDNLTWIIVTKRIGNAKRMLPADWGDGWSHVWLLSTVVNQEEADRDVPKLLSTPAAVRGLSVEPILGEIRFRWTPYAYEATGETYRAYLERQGSISEYEALSKLDWIIAGGESGAHARPPNPHWLRSLRDQCQAAQVPFFFKQWGGRTAKANGRRLDGLTWDGFPLEGQHAAA